MAESGVLLKDKNGNSITYSNIKQISFNGKYDGRDTEYLYTRLSYLNSYTAYQQNDGTYLITGLADRFPLQDLYIFGIDENDCKERGTLQSDGKYGLLVILTVKTLVVGNAYDYRELY